MRAAVGVVLLAASLFAAAAPAARDGRVDLTRWNAARDGPALLDGDWSFVEGRLVPGDAPWPAEAGSRRVPGSWNDGWRPGVGAGTYRLLVACDGTEALSLYFPLQHSAARVYANGREVLAQGVPGLGPPEHQPRAVHQHVTLGVPACPVDLRVQVSNFEWYRGGLVRGLELGTREQIEQARMSAAASAAAIVAVAAALGLFSFFLYVGERKRATGLYFTLFCWALVLGMVFAVNRERIAQPLLDGIRFDLQVRTLLQAWLAVSAMYPATVRSLYPRQAHDKVGTALVGACLVASALNWAVPASGIPWVHAAVWVLGPLGVAYAAFLLLRACVLRERDAPLVFASLVFVAAAGVSDLFVFPHVHGLKLLPFGIIAMVLAPAWIMAGRFRLALASEELRALELGERADLLLRATQAGVLDVDLPSGAVRASQRYREMLGLPPDAPAARLPAFDALVHPEDREAAAPLFEPRPGGATPGLHRLDPVEFRMVRADGRVIWVHSEAISIASEDGRPLRRILTLADITHLKSTEQQLREAQSRLVAEARRAGMAQIATNVLHNVGNVLTSVNVSAHVLAERIRGSRVPRVRDVARLLQPTEAPDPDGERARRLPGYVSDLAQALETEQAELLGELDRLRTSVDHIKNVVAMQQSYAGRSGTREETRASELVEDALRIHQDAIARLGVAVSRDYGPVPVLALDRTRIMQVLVNLLENALHAMEASAAERRLHVAVRRHGGALEIRVADTGCGVAQGDLPKIFSHGFSTKPHGHGFGLHSCAVAAREMGGEMAVASDGPGLGATFTLRLPAGADEATAATHDVSVSVP